MPRLSPARAAVRRQQIIDAALLCFAQRGFHRSTLQDVVRVSGLSAGSIYCHFASKEDIVYAVVEAWHRSDLQNLERALNANRPRRSFGAPGERLFRFAGAARRSCVAKACGSALGRKSSRPDPLEGLFATASRGRG
jgi:AcrR family transcriptional regulator